jgi:hypothetical protein
MIEEILMKTSRLSEVMLSLRDYARKMDMTASFDWTDNIYIYL